MTLAARFRTVFGRVEQKEMNATALDRRRAVHGAEWIDANSHEPINWSEPRISAVSVPFTSSACLPRSSV